VTQIARRPATQPGPSAADLTPNRTLDRGVETIIPTALRGRPAKADRAVRHF
jgi:hypothetical protein